MKWVKFENFPDHKIHLLLSGDKIYIRGTILQPFLFQLCGSMDSLSEVEFTHICVIDFPNELKERLDVDENSDKL